MVSSDAVRKRLAHLGPFESARAEHYSARFTRATYERLGDDALLALEREDRVIVDATCRSREERSLLLGRVASSRPGSCVVVRCEVPLELALERAARRLSDPGRMSDATPQITEEQFRSFEELDERADGSGAEARHDPGPVTHRSQRWPGPWTARGCGGADGESARTSPEREPVERSR